MYALFMIALGVGIGYAITSILLKNFSWNRHVKGYRAFFQPVALCVYLILFGVLGLNFFV